MDSDTPSNQSETSMDYIPLHQNFIETIATKLYNAKLAALSDKNVPQSSRNTCELLIKWDMQHLFGNEIYERIITAHDKMYVQHSVDVPQNDDIQIHVTI